MLVSLLYANESKLNIRQLICAVRKNSQVLALASLPAARQRLVHIVFIAPGMDGGCR